ncbi:MAG TPA: trehalose utilization protein ThuA [Armatimonadetes bacterium]|nr:trehalose utilization protein ThuA [Armatimonadota bacterium]
MSDKLRVTVWNEFKHEVDTNHPASTIYPEGMHKVIADYLNNAGFAAGTATLAEPEHGLTEEVLANTDVLIWWGHMAHHEVSDEIVARVHARVLAGMGLVVLHSGHFSKIFQRLMGTTCNLKWREAGENERLWVIDRTHPIAAGLPEWIDLPEEEMYGEPFDIPAPDQLVLISWFAGGEVFRSGACWSRGHGKVFYFRPGHESHPTYYNEQVLQVIANGVRWAAPLVGQPKMEFGNVQPLESLD